MQTKYKVIIALIIVAMAFCGLYYYFGIYLPNEEEKAEHERLVREYYEAKIALYEQENERYSDYEVDVAFIGDSLTDGYDLEKYYPQYITANRGIGGDTTFGLEERLAVSVYDLKPKVVVMLIGGNNLDTMFENYEDILVGLGENLPNTKIVLVSLTAMGKDWARKNNLAAFNNVKIKALAEKYGYSYVDLFTPLLDVDTNEIRSEYTNDGAHQTDLGYEVFTSEITTVIEKILNNGENAN